MGSGFVRLSACESAQGLRRLCFSVSESQQVNASLVRVPRQRVCQRGSDNQVLHYCIPRALMHIWLKSDITLITYPVVFARPVWLKEKLVAGKAEAKKQNRELHRRHTPLEPLPPGAPPHVAFHEDGEFLKLFARSCAWVGTREKIQPRAQALTTSWPCLFV